MRSTSSLHGMECPYSMEPEWRTVQKLLLLHVLHLLMKYSWVQTFRREHKLVATILWRVSSENFYYNMCNS